MQPQLHHRAKSNPRTGTRQPMICASPLFGVGEGAQRPPGGPAVDRPSDADPIHVEQLTWQGQVRKTENTHEFGLTGGPRREDA